MVICGQNGLGGYRRWYQEASCNDKKKKKKKSVEEPTGRLRAVLALTSLVMLCLLFSETIPSEARIGPYSFLFLLNNNPFLS